MNHSLLGANRRTHLKSAAIAVLVSLLLVTALNIGGTSRITNVPRTGQAVHGLAGGKLLGSPHSTEAPGGGERAALGPASGHLRPSIGTSGRFGAGLSDIPVVGGQDEGMSLPEGRASDRALVPGASIHSGSTMSL